MNEDDFTLIINEDKVQKAIQKIKNPRFGVGKDRTPKTEEMLIKEDDNYRLRTKLEVIVAAYKKEQHIWKGENTGHAILWGEARFGRNRRRPGMMNSPRRHGAAEN